MMIHVLAPDVAARIAAGEVVERPANVAKELIENSLDAGATVIRVEVREGGRRLLRVTDNGSGMPAAEAPTALLRHATSKLQTSEELEHIGTFGFRGEALYSIAAVSHMTLQSRHRDEEFAAVLAIEGGELRATTRVGAPAGTTVSVEHLFFNTPARLKFLRSATAEAGQLAAVVQRYALAFPTCRFTYVNEQRTVFQTSGSGELFDVVVQIHGLDAARQMVAFDSGAMYGSAATPEANPEDEISFGEVDAGAEADAPLESSAVAPLRVHGLASMPSLTRGNRTGIQIFVNRRAVEDRNLTFAVTQAYHTLLQTGRYPLALVFLEMDPSLVDVNVHPQKLQVRFAEDRRVFHEVQKSVRRAIIENLSAPGLAGSLPATPASSDAPTWDAGGWASRRDALLNAGNAPQFPFAAARSNLIAPAARAHEAYAGEDDREQARDARAAASPAHPFAADEYDLYTASYANTAGTQPAPPRDLGSENRATDMKSNLLPPLRVVGQVGATYIVAEGPAGMFLIDQHAAHERILYEQFMDRRYGAAPAGQDAPSQQLLQPVILHDGSEEAGQVASHLRELQRVGFAIEPFGGDSFILRAVPSLLANEDALGSLLDIVSSLAGGRNLVSEGYEAALVKMVCKRAAIKAGQLLSAIEMQELLRQLEQCRSPRTCPHGRPTVIQISAGDLQKAFGRI